MHRFANPVAERTSTFCVDLKYSVAAYKYLDSGETLTIDGQLKCVKQKNRICKTVTLTVMSAYICMRAQRLTIQDGGLLHPAPS